MWWHSCCVPNPEGLPEWLSEKERKYPKFKQRHPTPKPLAAGGKGGGWGYLGLVEELPDQILFATHTSGHNSMRRDLGQVALLIFVHRLPGVVQAEQLILVPVSLVGQVLWGRKAQRSWLTAGRAIACGPPSSLNHRLFDLVEITF